MTISLFDINHTETNTNTKMKMEKMWLNKETLQNNNVDIAG